MAISGSGRSHNIIKAIEYAQKKGAKTIGFLGYKTGGQLAKIKNQADSLLNSNNKFIPFNNS